MKTYRKKDGIESNGKEEKGIAKSRYYFFALAFQNIVQRGLLQEEKAIDDSDEEFGQSREGMASWIRFWNRAWSINFTIDLK